MSRSLLIAIVTIGMSGCSPSAPPDPRQTPAPHDYAYYQAHPAETAAQKVICDQIPPQARSTVLAGNCHFAESALSMRGFGDENAQIFKSKVPPKSAAAPSAGAPQSAPTNSAP